MSECNTSVQTVPEDGGFYPGVVVKESDNSYITRDDTIVFTSSDFNVADGVDGKPTVTINDSGIDHGSLSGLADDDHPQYARKLADWNTFRQGITAEAFYLAQGGEVFAYDFNREHFYVTPSKVNISRKVVNLDVQYLDVDGTRAMTGPLQIVDGLTTEPGLQFDSDNNLGIYRAGVDRMVLVAANSDVLQIRSSFGVSQIQLPGISSASIPALTSGESTGFGTYGDTGLFFDADANNPFMGVAVDGVEAARFGPDGVRVADKVIAEAFYLDSGGEFSRTDGIVLRHIGTSPEAPSLNHIKIFALNDLGVNGKTFLKFRNETSPVIDVLGDRVFTVHNGTGSTITAGNLVCITGQFGDISEVAIADASSLTTMPAVGVTIEDIQDLSFGMIMSDGTFLGVNTFSFGAGDELFVSTTPGAFTNVRPSSPDISQSVGFVSVVDVNGLVLMNISGTDPAPSGGGGFYGIVIKESDGSFVTRDDTIVFTSSDFNVADVSGKPTVTIVDSGIDHGSLSGLADDDHPQYALTDGSRDITGHQDFLDGILVENKVEAEAFYTTSFGEVFPSPYRVHFRDVSFTNTGAEIDIFNDTIPGGALGTNRALEVKIRGTVYNFVGSVRTFDFKVYWGGVARVAYTTGSVANTNSLRMVAIDARLKASGSAQVQYLSGFNRVGVANTIGATGLVSGLGIDNIFGTKDDVGVDSTQDQQFRVTITPSAASPAYSFYFNDIEAEIR